MAMFLRDPKAGDLPAEPGPAGTRGPARWLERLRSIVLRNPEPASRSFRYLARLIDRELGGRTTGIALGISGIDSDDSPADALLMLAYCLRSELDSRVLIIDARLKDVEGGVTGRLAIAGAPGFAQLMRSGPGQHEQLIQHTRIPGVDVLPSGQVVTGAVASLDRSTLRHLVAWAKGEYDQVLVQIGSVLRDTRNAATAAELDAVFLVADEHRTFMKQLDDCRQILLSNGAQQVKIIVAGGHI